MWLGNNENSITSKTVESMELTGEGVGLGAPANVSPAHIHSKQDTIPEDPVLAETHYTEVYAVMFIVSHDLT